MLSGGGQALEPPCKKAFTLTELLLALTIVGVLAVLTVPILMNNIHKRMYVTQLRNMVANIQQVAQDELITHRTRDLSDTDFGDPELLLTDKHFSIAETCSASTALKDCWKVNATGKDKIVYKTIRGSITSFSLNRKSIFLKNGVLLSYILKSNDGKTVGYFTIDLNGNDKPNVWGRDAFVFYITPKGEITDIATITNVQPQIGKCQGGTNIPAWCYSLLVSKNWKMDY